MPKSNKTRYALLGVLAYGPASGYDIKKFCDRSISHFWNENYGHIYPVLKELEAGGLVEGETHLTPGRPPRTVYSITERGREALRSWLLQPVEPQPVRHELLLKLLFAGNAPRESIVGKLEEAAALHTGHLEEYRRIRETYESNPELAGKPDSPYWMSALSYGIQDAEFRIRWCEETIRRLRENSSENK